MQPQPHYPPRKRDTSIFVVLHLHFEAQEIYCWQLVWPTEKLASAISYRQMKITLNSVSACPIFRWKHLEVPPINTFISISIAQHQSNHGPVCACLGTKLNRIYWQLAMIEIVRIIVSPFGIRNAVYQRKNPFSIWLDCRIRHIPCAGTKPDAFYSLAWVTNIWKWWIYVKAHQRCTFAIHGHYKAYR